MTTGASLLTAAATLKPQPFSGLRRAHFDALLRKWIDCFAMAIDNQTCE